ncbi:MAG: hypothetical protein HPAVJP_2930 [Candidatus Hepatoplasma vulgare]|nr:MAG: hypothetical protein HPAVJP_2930 [Candidatus Hepatoplasma sp.]
MADDSTMNPTEGINQSLNQIINNQNEILELKNQMENLKLPIGSIIISLMPPRYGFWESLGILSEGQAIIGCSSNNGNIISHNHQWSARITNFAADVVTGFGNSINKFNTYDQGGNSKIIGNTVPSESADNCQTAWTSLTGSKDKNKAYDLGVGTGMRVFKRTA